MGFRARADFESFALVNPYPQYIGSGTWRKYPLYSMQAGLNMTQCGFFTSMCNTLGDLFARRDERTPLRAHHEEAFISELAPGSLLLPHQGAPTRLNMHMGISG